MEQPRHNSAKARDSLAPSRQRLMSISLTQQEYADLRDWMNANGYEKQSWEKLDHWQHRTRLISYAYAQIDEMANVGHALPRSAAECEQIMQDEHGSHCANPEEHELP